MLGTMRATLSATLVVLTTVAWAETHEPLARFFENPQQTPSVSPHPDRRHARPAVPSASAPQAVVARRSAPAMATKPDFVIGVFGDSFAASVARGLNDGDPSAPARDVVDASADDAGVATLDATAWGDALDAARKDAGRLDAAILMVGRNDGVALTDTHGQPQEPGSPGWQQLYGDRVAAIADRFRDKHVPLIWVGLPIVRDAGQAQTYATLNEITHDRVVREGATFIDTWQAFADENGDFSTLGPDVDGRPATLRWSNGWNFTRAGARKLASFVVPDLNRIRDRLRSTQELASVPNANPDSFDQALSIDVNAQILREAGLQPSAPVRPADALAAPQPQAGPVMVLTAAPLAKDGRLASIDPPTHPPTPDSTLVAHAGRADDFAWPRP